MIFPTKSAVANRRAVQFASPAAATTAQSRFATGIQSAQLNTATWHPILLIPTLFSVLAAVKFPGFIGAPGRWRMSRRFQSDLRELTEAKQRRNNSHQKKRARLIDTGRIARNRVSFRPQIPAHCFTRPMSYLKAMIAANRGGKSVPT